ncbi:MAG: HK97-gp10 family putative phage morphogenesis protein [Ruminiclostridium sp.]
MKSYENEISAALQKTAELAFFEAKACCPVRTGRLKNSIQLSHKGNSAVIGTDVEYAPAVELGTERQQPKSFLGRGINAAKSQAAQIFISEMFGKRSKKNG